MSGKYWLCVVAMLAFWWMFYTAWDINFAELGPWRVISGFVGLLMYGFFSDMASDERKKK